MGSCERRHARKMMFTGSAPCNGPCLASIPRLYGPDGARVPMERSMYRHHHWADDEAERKAAERQTASLAAIVIVLFLLAGGLFLVQRLRVAAAIEDCLMAGRRNCDALVVGRH